MKSRISERYGVNDRPWAMATGMTLPQARLVEAVNLGKPPLQIDAVTFPAAVRGLAVGDAVSGTPACRMASGAVQGRGLVVGFAAAEQGAAGCSHNE